MDELAEMIRRDVDNLPVDRLEDFRNEPSKNTRQLAYVWADNIHVELNTSEVIGGLLSTTGLTVLYGESGCGKTFFTLDMACHLAAGLEWYGNPVEQGPVLYVAAEAPASVEKRVVAWKIRHDVQNLPLAVVQSSVDMMNGDTEAIIDLGKQIEAKHGRVALVVIDTLSRAMTGNENSPDDMGKFVMACGKIREELGTHVLVVHHSGKDLARGARGHSSLRAATDVEIEVAVGEDKTHTAMVTKHRDGPQGTVFAFNLDVVELGTNIQGRVVTTCVTNPVEGVTRHARSNSTTKERPLTGHGVTALKALEIAINDVGERPPPHDQTKGVTRAVTVEQWRNYFMQCYGLTTDDPKEKSNARVAWKRGHEAMLGKKKASIWGGFVWLLR